MYQVKNTITGEPAQQIADVPHALSGPLALRKTKHKTDEQGNLLYFKTVEQAIKKYEFVDGEMVEVEQENPQYETVQIETVEAGYTITVTDKWNTETGEAEESHEEFTAYPPVIVDDGAVFEWVEVVPTPAEIALQIQTELTNAVQAHLDNTAKLKGYDGILSATSYAALPVGEPFQSEGVQYALWRSAVWVRCYEVLAGVQDGTREIPTADELLAELPELGGE